MSVLTMFSAIYDLFYTHHTNPLIHYMQSTDYRIAIAARRVSEDHTKTPDLKAGSWLNEMFYIFNNATEAEKTEFLQHAESQQKFFEIIGGLFLYFSFSRNPCIPFCYLDDCLGILTLEPAIERQFYHSKYFINCAKLEAPLRGNVNIPPVTLDAIMFGIYYNFVQI